MTSPEIKSKHLKNRPYVPDQDQLNNPAKKTKSQKLKN